MSDKIFYRGYHIYPNPVNIAASVDWCYAHKDFDGAPDAGDNRYGYAASIEACKAEIDERLDDG